MDIEQRDRIINKAGITLGQRSDGPSSAFLCACGCGEPTRYTKGSWSHFRPGHDARLVGILLRLSRDGELEIGDAVEFVNREFSDRLAMKLLRYWNRLPPRAKISFCTYTVPCGRPSAEGDPHGDCDHHTHVDS